MKKISIVFYLIILNISYVYSQSRTIKGRIISDFSDILLGVSIFTKDSIKVGNTDLKGFFEVEIPVSEKRISFSYIGMEPTNINLENNCTEINVIMVSESTYDFMTLKKVDKIRKKKYKKLPKLHKEAFDNGIFSTDKSCYNQEFIPYYKKK